MLSNNRNHRERGMTVAMLAVFIIGLLAMAALAIDLGVLYTARTSAQHAADAAALAGALTFIDSTSAQPAAAQEAAIATAGANFVLGKVVTISAAEVNVDIPNRLVTVTVPLIGASGIGTYFARAIQVKSVDVTVQASAEASLVGAGSRCLKPLFIPNTILSTQDPVLACAAGEKIFERVGGGVPPLNCTQPTEHSSWFTSNNPVGGAYQIRPGNPANALVPSQFYALDFGAGGSDYRCTLGGCTNDCGITNIPSCGDSYPVKTGNMIGPTNQGVDDLTGANPDIWLGVGQYEDGFNGLVYPTSNQLVVAPVWDNCCQVINPGTNGQTAMIVGFVDLFIDASKGGGDVDAHLVSTTPRAGLGGGGGGPGGGGAPP
ncbi:MAG: pilus assembly protein TadG-related protein, partial [Acidobacteria bacterium]|nr:pilus assembly protein TadG-related protein [Acidobacteriota bacterium]